MFGIKFSFYHMVDLRILAWRKYEFDRKVIFQISFNTTNYPKVTGVLSVLQLQLKRRSES
jgi:hypothetical protein